MSSLKRRRATATSSVAKHHKRASAASSLPDDDDAEQAALEQFVFGDMDDEIIGSDDGDDQVDLPLFRQDRAPGQNQDDDDDSSSENEPSTARAAWADSDDDEVEVDISKVDRLRKLRQSETETVVSGAEYQRRLRDQFTELSSTQNGVKAGEWASNDKAAGGSDGDSSEDGEGEDELDFLRGTASLSAKSARLPAHSLQVVKMKDANHQSYAKSVVSSIGWHPSGSGNLLFAAGLDKCIRLFAVDGVQNQKAQSVLLDDLQIRCAHWTADGGKILASGRRKFFYEYDVQAGKVLKIPSIKGRATTEKSLENFTVSPDGRFIAFVGNHGCIVLVSQVTKQWVADLKMNGTVRAIEFSRDGSELYSIGGDGAVYVWDLSTRRCRHRFVDEGCAGTGATAIALAPNQQTLACASSAGVVNFYDSATARQSRAPQPQKAVMNLTTAVDDITFNHSAEIAAISSRRKKDAMRLVHIPSMTVFANWPTSETPLHYVNCTAFSPQSGYLAIGNDRGKVLLYRLSHYQQS